VQPGDDRRTLPELIQSERLLLRRWLISDAQALGRAVRESEAHLRPWMPFMALEPQTHAQRRQMLAEREREFAQGGDVMIGVFLDGRVVGSCGLRHGRAHTLEIGYWIHPAFTRKGLASETARLLTDAAFTVPDIAFVEIHHDQANLASRGVARSVGFQLACELPRTTRAPAEVGIDCVWRIGRADWERQRGQAPSGT
jgi:RimJ/RimL family protein N-acetyltransferase